MRQRTAWSLALSVTSDEPVGYPPAVFVFQEESPGDPATRGWFTAIASPAQLLEYPVNATAEPEGDGLWQPYYRKAALTLVSRHPADLEQLYREIEAEILRLRLDLDALQLLAEATEVVL